MRLLLIRHGETTWNATGKSQGQTDTDLSERGVEQAQLLARSLSTERFTTIVSSDLRRASRTADAIAAHHPEASRGEDPRVREMSLGAWEGLHTDDIVARFAAEREAWLRSPASFRMPGGESFGELQERVTTAVDALIASHGPDDSVVVVSHGYALLSYFVGLLGMPIDGFRRLWLQPTGVSEVQVHSGFATLRRLNDTSHLRSQP